MAKGKGKQGYARSHGITTRRVTNRGGLGAYNVMRARSENRRGYAIFNRERLEEEPEPEAEPEDSEQSQSRPDQGMMIAGWSLFGLIVLAVLIFIILFLFF